MLTHYARDKFKKLTTKQMLREVSPMVSMFLSPIGDKNISKLISNGFTLVYKRVIIIYLVIYHIGDKG